MTGKTVLLVDDEQAIRELLALYLNKEGFTVHEAADGAEALIKNQEYKPDIIILDIMMPVLDGLEVCRQIRKFSNIPIIMLTSRAEDEDRIMGLELGADDYVTKPFNSREVVARVKAVLRRLAAPQQQPAPALSYPHLTIDMAKHTVTAFDQEISFANKEIELLWELAAQPGRAFSREQLLESVWGYSYCGDTRTVDTHIKRIRKKLAINATSPWDIKTVWGIGYKFEVKK
ncbi:Transcriptional regulatory protein SrrA [Sporomusa ovata DSM 2662]|uniref:Phosphate regulon transcriptional regulatory protein PhoB (SphR) n=1 Tax=Sporomusa ovata TaxID=2378 RepID=A0A0U1KZB7_9FIRM|nr:response regulator transcription factor [Sporomusa ovata]EQB28364.1 transcriptional regulatory protein ResD [Sporomusa ovata DSM 2662]CQR72004.1 Phosphate regulon transcriptional regulatory protein PhoB (SphR) [Sporomusa ovata]